MKLTTFQLVYEQIMNSLNADDETQAEDNFTVDATFI